MHVFCFTVTFQPLRVKVKGLFSQGKSLPSSSVKAEVLNFLWIVTELLTAPVHSEPAFIVQTVTEKPNILSTHTLKTICVKHHLLERAFHIIHHFGVCKNGHLAFCGV